MISMNQKKKLKKQLKTRRNIISQHKFIKDVKEEQEKEMIYLMDQSDINQVKIK